MIGRGLSALGVALTGGAAAAYVTYTIGGVTRLRGPLLRWRRPVVAAGVVASGLGAMLEPGPCTAAGLAATLGLAAYGVRRQWLLPREAPSYGPGDGGAGLAVVLPDGGRVPLRALASDRVARVGPWLVVHCGLAGAVSVFDWPGAAVRAVLPHESGFVIAVGERLYDGVDGASLEGRAGLSSRPLQLVRAGRGVAMVPMGGVPPQREVRPLVPGARGVEDAMALGAVHGDTWERLPAAGSEPSAPCGRILARWAARVRGLRGA